MFPFHADGDSCRFGIIRVYFSEPVRKLGKETVYTPSMHLPVTATVWDVMFMCSSLLASPVLCALWLLFTTMW